MSEVFDGARRNARETVGNAVVKALRDRGFEAVYAESKEKALGLILDRIPRGATVGIPGTVSVRELGAIEALESRGCIVYQHWGPLTPEARLQARMNENAADFFLTSANALTQDGEIISIDADGNRVSAMAWGQGVLIFVIGINKLAFTLEEGIRRARSASIPNALRLGNTTPCAKAGCCVDCRGVSRLCRATLILEAPTHGRETHVILVGAELGY
ncbi:MAG: lactate utilization protein [Fretibacterium sp.]|nr:lactate utilization protein [Fretibacterium sp.]